MPPEGVPLNARDDILSYEEVTALVAGLQRAFGVAKVRITGGEPLVRVGIERLVGMLAALGIPDLALTTNGLQLAEMAVALKRAGLRRVNVSLDSLSPGTFKTLTAGGDLQAVVDGIDAALAAGLIPLKLNTVVMRGINDTELGVLLDFALVRHCELRFIELMPIGPGAAMFPREFVPSDEVRRALSAHARLRPVAAAVGSAARRYAAVTPDGRGGTVGFISSCSAPFCADCSRLRITSDGRLIGCLARDGGLPVRDLLRAGDMDAIAAAARCVLEGKTADRKFEQEMAMASIGG